MRVFVLFAVFAFAMLSATLSTSPHVYAQSSVIISEVRVEGNQRIEDDTVKSYLLVSAGTPYDPSRVDRSLKALFNTGLFADVSIRQDGTVLIVDVVENPIINRLAFEGNRRIDDETLAAEIQLRPRIVYTRARVQNDVQRIITVYRRSGRFAATVEPKVILLPENRVDLVFEINEGEATGIKKIRFYGNKNFSDSQLLSEISTEETRWYNFLSDSDTYDPDRLTFDRELLRKFYLSKGYADFRVVSAIAELTPDRDGFFITFAVEEGQKYSFGAIDVKSEIKDVSPDALMAQVTTIEGETYNADKIEDTIQKITFELGKLGYAFVNVRPRIDRDRENLKISVTYEINKGPRVYVERINITGNVRTLDYVIRREMKLAEGDAFNTALLRLSQSRVRGLNFFEKVEVTQEEGTDADKTVINIDVQEKSTGELSVGAGFSTTEDVSADLQIRERNLLGRGQDLRFGVSVGSDSQTIDVGFTEPYFLNRDLSAGFDIFRTVRDYQDESGYDLERTGFSLRSGFPIKEKIRGDVFYSLVNEKIDNVQSTAPVSIQKSAGEYLISSVGYTITISDLDDTLLPTTGSKYTFGQIISGLGGDVRSLATNASYIRFFPVYENDVVLSAGITGGYIFGLGEDVILAQRYNVGGRNFRGFESRGIGPRDLASGDALGGNAYFVASSELRFPVGLPQEYGVLGRTFIDVGTLTEIDDNDPGIVDSASIRAAVGVGLNWVSPFGPIQINVAVPIMKEDYDKDEIFQFDFGTRF
ncbi:outer membrane protein assembly factor BamA [Sneathiella sp. CAU 1612]|uniref:Outer membrane protein assembly factor BamA n=1 Tax=Sneathiella sedimenti TaxID=2816034 RepID=A0ABS3F912_9PROT|nr:outer membrane protein assembly factor BamA [Sneathiella sedimenti]MBO0335001.1 outer membrane protein assembly factor BamA [Sneathiella sedimenti]